MRIWVRQCQNNRTIADLVIEDDTDVNRTKKIFLALEQACHAFDLSQPIWLDATIREFQKFAKARFFQDHFVEEIAFDYMEIVVLEED